MEPMMSILLMITLLSYHTKINSLHPILFCRTQSVDCNPSYAPSQSVRCNIAELAARSWKWSNCIGGESMMSILLMIASIHYPSAIDRGHVWQSAPDVIADDSMISPAVVHSIIDSQTNVFQAKARDRQTLCTLLLLGDKGLFFNTIQLLSWLFFDSVKLFSGEVVIVMMLGLLARMLAVHWDIFIHTQ